MVYLFIRFFSKAWTRSDRCGCLAYTILQTRSRAAGFQRTFTQVWGGTARMCIVCKSHLLGNHGLGLRTPNEKGNAVRRLTYLFLGRSLFRNIITRCWGWRLRCWRFRRRSCQWSGSIWRRCCRGRSLCGSSTCPFLSKQRVCAISSRSSANSLFDRRSNVRCFRVSCRWFSPPLFQCNKTRLHEKNWCLTCKTR